MKILLISMAVAAAAGISLSANAQAPASAPSGSTALCKDGTYYAGATKKAPAPDTRASRIGMVPSQRPRHCRAAGPASKAPAPAAPAGEKKTAAAPGGGPGQVWANSSTKVYHCPTDRYYGKTKTGEYMSEADAKAKGFKPDHGKACS